MAGRTDWHIKNNIRHLAALADRELKEGDGIGRSHGRAIEDQVLNLVVKTHETVIAWVLSCEHDRAAEAGTSLDHWPVR